MDWLHVKQSLHIPMFLLCHYDPCIFARLRIGACFQYDIIELDRGLEGSLPCMMYLNLLPFSRFDWHNNAMCLSNRLNADKACIIQCATISKDDTSTAVGSPVKKTSIAIIMRV